MKTIFQYYIVSYGTIKEKHAHHRAVFGQGRRKINLSKRPLEVGNDKVTSKNVEKSWYYNNDSDITKADFITLLNVSPTCGTHFGDTKLVTSITGSPASESLFMNSTLVSVGTNVWWKKRIYLNMIYTVQYLKWNKVISVWIKYPW